jgi:hypothetical protein
LLAFLLAAIIAAAVTYAGAVVGGIFGEGIAATADDSIGRSAKSLYPGAIVTVRGNWLRDPDQGFNELLYVTAINRTGMFPRGPDYTTVDADSTPPDDCPLAPAPPG